MDLGPFVSLRIVKRYLERSNIFSKIAGLRFCLEFSLKAPLLLHTCFFAFYATFLVVNQHSAITLFVLLLFTPCQAEQPLRRMELKEKEVQID